MPHPLDPDVPNILCNGLIRVIGNVSSSCRSSSGELSAFPTDMFSFFYRIDPTKYLLLRIVPRLPITVYFSGDLHWDRDNSLELLQAIILNA